MWIAEQWQDYELLDCGGGEKGSEVRRRTVVAGECVQYILAGILFGMERRAGGEHLLHQIGL